MDKKIIIFVIISFLFVAISGLEAKAASLDFVSTNKQILVGAELEVKVLLNPGNEEVNAISAEINFPTDLLVLKNIKDGNSIISFWVEKPQETSQGKVSFSGIMPGGYYEKNGYLLSLIFKAAKAGTGAIKINSSQVLKNDGIGTALAVATTPLKIGILEKETDQGAPEVPSELVYNFNLDNDEPEIFYPQISSDQNLFSGQWFLVFATQDKGSGIDHYEVKEGRENFIRAESPYLLKNQQLNVPLAIKAVDKNGNERIMEMPAKNKPWYADKYFYGIIIVLILSTGYFIWRRKQKK